MLNRVERLRSGDLVAFRYDSGSVSLAYVCGAFRSPTGEVWVGVVVDRNPLELTHLPIDRVTFVSDKGRFYLGLWRRRWEGQPLVVGGDIRLSDKLQRRIS